MTMNNNEQKLRDWLEEYDLDRILAEESPPAGQESPLPPVSDQAPPAEGQIRLWPSTHGADPPLYGLLLAGTYGTWRVIPFSTLSLPATPQEWACRDQGPARVLQGWNRREVPSSRIQTSWFAEDAAAELLLTARSWWLNLESGGPASPAIAPRLGPPLWHPADPRHDFLAAECDRVNRSLGESLALRLDEPVAAWAAEGSARYGARRWEIGDTGDLWVADETGGWIESSAGKEAWLGALVRSSTGQWTWRGEKIPVPGADESHWVELLWRGQGFPLRFPPPRCKNA